MTRDEAVARIQQDTDYRSGQTDVIVGYLKMAQRLLEKGKDLPRFLIEEDATLVATTGSAEIALPTGFLREVEESEFRYYSTEDAEWVTLEKMGINEAETRFGDADAGKPVAYVLRKDTIAFYPERDTNYTLTWSYYKAAAVLDTDIENAWLKHNPDVLIGKAGYHYALSLSNANAADRFLKLYGEAWANQFAEDVERDRDNAPIHMGGRL